MSQLQGGSVIITTLSSPGEVIEAHQTEEKEMSTHFHNPKFAWDTVIALGKMA